MRYTYNEEGKNGIINKRKKGLRGKVITNVVANLPECECGELATIFQIYVL